MDELCCVCLRDAPDLKLLSGETNAWTIYRDIVGITEYAAPCLLVCWCCEAALNKHARYNDRVRKAYRALIEGRHKTILYSSNLSLSHNEVLESYPSLAKHEIDIDIVKEECPLNIDYQNYENDTTNDNITNNYQEDNNSVDKLDIGNDNLISDHDDFNNDNDTEDYTENVVDLKSHKEPETFVKKLKVKGRKKKEGKRVREKAKEKIDKKTVKKELPVKNHKCSKCDFTATSVPRVQSHVYSAHGDRPECVPCSKTFSSAKTYRYHVNVLHKGDNSFPCALCDKVFQWKSNLWRHLKSHKARQSGELFCLPCGRSFSSIATLRQHQALSRSHVHESDYRFMCNDCGKRFVSKSKLRDHIDWEHLRLLRHTCTTCQKPFKSGTSLYMHVQNVHSGANRDNLCHVCGKKYQSASKLKSHIAALHSTSVHACGQCGASFGWYSSLYRHQRDVHRETKPKKSLKKMKGADVDMINRDAIPTAV